jgi:hypothetical protein
LQEIAGETCVVFIRVHLIPLISAYTLILCELSTMSGKKCAKGGKSKNSVSSVDGEDVILKLKEESKSPRLASYSSL